MVRPPSLFDATSPGWGERSTLYDDATFRDGTFRGGSHGLRSSPLRDPLGEGGGVGGVMAGSPVGRSSGDRIKVAQIRAALAFDAHKLRFDEMDAFEKFRAMAVAFRGWRANAAWHRLAAEEEARAFEAAVARWLSSVSHWELRLCGKFLLAWAAYIRKVKQAGEQCGMRHTKRLMHTTWWRIVGAFRERVSS